MNSSRPSIGNRAPSKEPLDFFLPSASAEACSLRKYSKNQQSLNRNDSYLFLGNNSILSRSPLFQRLHSQDEVSHHQLLLSLLFCARLLGQRSLKSLLEHPHAPFSSSKDIILALDLLALRNLATLNGKYFEHFLFLVRSSVVFYKQLEALHFLQTQQSIRNLLVHQVSSTLEELIKRPPLEIRHPFTNILYHIPLTFCKYFCSSARYSSKTLNSASFPLWSSNTFQ